jgi:rhomboid family protein
MALLIPTGVDVYLERSPWVNWLLMGVIVSISLAALRDDGVFLRYSGISVDFRVDEESGAFVPRPVVSTHEVPLVGLAITSTFLHADWLHLAGNMLFLWVFGNAVNSKLGHPLYLVFYLLAGFGGSMAHYLIEGGPVVGASGAINGVMGAFLVFFPLNDVKMLYVWGIGYRRGSLVGTFSLSGIWVIAMYVAWDVFYLVTGLDGTTALWAHIVGFLVGFGIALTLLLTGRIRSTQDEQSILCMIGKD